MLKKSFPILAGSISLFLSSLVLSCGQDSGLGSSVDTEPPAIEITYPPLAAQIRDTFILAGTCADDKSMKKVEITVTNTETKEIVDKLEAEIADGEKNWTVEVNPFDTENNKYKYSDGNYLFTALAHDGAGHSTSDNRSFDIDNTAPVFVISNPGVIKSQNKKASAYGSAFTVDGTIADDHTIASLTSKIYDSNGELIGEYKEEDIPTAGGSSVTIASHYVDKGDGSERTSQNERYSAVYGDDDSAGTKNFYTTIIIADSTKQYKDPGESENNTSGNTSSKVYLYDSVYKELMSSRSGNQFGLTVSDMMQILNGSKKHDEALAILKAAAIDTGAESETDKDGNKLSFSLNPMANPTYNVNGFTATKDADGNLDGIEASSGNTVSITINAGLDGTAVLPGKVKAWTVLVDGLSEEAALAKVEVVARRAVAAQKIYDDGSDSAVAAIHEAGAEIEEAVTSNYENGEVSLILDNSGDSGSSVKVGNISGTLPRDKYAAGKLYAFVVTGSDEDDVAFSHSLYTFRASEAGMAPTLLIDNPANLSYIKASSNLIFNGKAYMSAGSTLKVESLTISLNVQNEEDGLYIVKGYIVKMNRDSNTGLYSFREGAEDKDEVLQTTSALTYNGESGIWSFNPSALAIYSSIEAQSESGKAYLYSADISASSTSGDDIVKTVSVHIDSIKPGVTITSISPYVDGSQFYSQEGNAIRNYVNGDISVRFNVAETNLSNVYYTVKVDDEEKVGRTDLGRVFSGTIALDTTKWTSSASEKKNILITIVADDSCGNEGSVTSTEYNVVSYQNGEESVTIEPNQPLIICQETDIPQISLGNAEYSYLSDESEKSLLVASGENSESVNTVNKKNIVYGHNLFNVDSNNTININLSDDDGLASASIKVYSEDGSSIIQSETKTLSTASYPWQYKLPAIEGIYQIEVEVTDSKLSSTPAESIAKIWRKNKSERFFIAIDNGAPIVEIKSPAVGSYQPTNFAANGILAEKTDVTLKRAVYSVSYNSESGKEEENLFGQVVDVTSKIGNQITSGSDNGKYPWAESNADITGIAPDGNYIIKYTATDRYLQSYTASARIIVDTKAPVFKDGESSVSVSSIPVLGKSAVEGTWFNSEALNLAGKFEEANGISNIHYWLDAETSQAATGSFTATTENGISTYRTTISGFTECSASTAHKLTLVAEDLAGNKSEPVVYESVKIDITAPSFDKYYYIMGGVEGEASGEILTNGSNDITLYGLISDPASGVKDLTLNIIDKNGNSSVFLSSADVKYTVASTEKDKTDSEGNVIVDGEGNPVKESLISTTENLSAWYKNAEFTAMPEDSTKVTAWKALIPKSTFAADDFEGGEIRATYSDIAGNSTKNLMMFRLNVDKNSPELANFSLSDQTDGFTACQANIESGSGDSRTVTYRYYVNNSSSHAFKLSGVATDNRGVASVDLKIGNDETKTQHLLTTGDFTFPIEGQNLDLSSLDGGENSKLTLVITDKAANITSKEILITPDVTAPIGEHTPTKDALEDMTFRIGESTNDQYETTNADSDKDVGDKYAPGTYGNSNSIKIRGYFAEEGSGLNMIYYKLFTSVPSQADVTNFAADYENLKTGYFAPLTSPEIKNVKDSDGSYPGIKANFKTLLSGFQEGNNYLVLIAVDKVGNADYDKISYTYTPQNASSAETVNCYAINVDTVVPELSDNVTVTIAGSSDGLSASQILTNFTKGDITLSGKALDSASGINGVELYVEGKGKNSSNEVISIEKTTKVTLNGVEYKSLVNASITDKDESDSAGTKKWSGTVAKNLFNDVKSGTFAVYATVKDKAGEGNTINRSVATIIVDKDAPGVVLSSPKDADTGTEGVQVNGIITLSGEISDGNLLPENSITAIQYALTDATISEDSDEGWTSLTNDSHTAMPNLLLSGSYTFTAASFDTSKLQNGKSYYLRAKACDSAGNVGYSARQTVTVNQDTDRPIIKLSSLDGAEAIISAQTIMGTVSDDDGVKKLEYSSDNGSSWNEITVNSGSWLVENIAGGEHSFKFRITDDANTVFETGKTFAEDSSEQHFASDGMPYVVYGKNNLDRTNDKNSLPVPFKVDLNPPVNVSMAVASTESSSAPSEPSSGSGEASPYVTTVKSFGGSASRYMWLKVTAREDV
ncbi:MAG: hypothetical protein K5873_00020, partial [Treponema sp.]|nr:hypothetical protein [Treponema sp.]